MTKDNCPRTEYLGVCLPHPVFFQQQFYAVLSGAGLPHTTNVMVIHVLDRLASAITGRQPATRSSSSAISLPRVVIDSTTIAATSLLCLSPCCIVYTVRT